MSSHHHLLERIGRDGRGGRGSITLYVGPMCSGKTSQLFREIETASHAGIPCYFVRPACDTRWEDIRTHGGKPIGADKIAEVVSAPTLAECAEVIAGKAERGCVVAVDEGQFFPDLAKGALSLVGDGCHVAVAALNGDFRQRPFPSVSALYPHCEVIEKFNAVCMRCKAHSASFTVKKAAPPPPEVDSEVALESEREIGGADIYESVCRVCLGG